MGTLRERRRKGSWVYGGNLKTKDTADSRRRLTWEEVEGKHTAEARLVAKGYQDPDLKDGNVDIAGCEAGGRHICS